tara:strand:+ start:57298 stop:58458 length:1161 start_codon:yes stop_codon:yes gene_type:complete
MKRLLTILLIMLQITVIAYSQKFIPPTQRYIHGQNQSIESIESNLRNYNENQIVDKDITLFHDLTTNEKLGLIGYHGANSVVGIYQDIIKTCIIDILNIPIRDNFQFLRIPGDKRLNNTSADDFLKEYNIYQQKVIIAAKKINNLKKSQKTKTSLSFEDALKIVKNYSLQKSKNKTELLLGNQNTLDLEISYIDDMTYDIQTKLLALNIALYQDEYDIPLTIYSYLYNYSWSDITGQLSSELKPFFEEMGINHKYIQNAFQIAKKHLPENRGLLIRISEKNNSQYKFIDTHGYISYPYGMPFGNKAPSYYYFTESITNFPELKLILSNKYSLNPNSNLIIERYNSMTSEQYDIYLEELRNYLKGLPYDTNKAQEYRKQLIQIWANI